MCCLIAPVGTVAPVVPMLFGSEGTTRPCHAQSHRTSCFLDLFFPPPMRPSLAPPPLSLRSETVPLPKALVIPSLGARTQHRGAPVWPGPLLPKCELLLRATQFGTDALNMAPKCGQTPFAQGRELFWVSCLLSRLFFNTEFGRVCQHTCGSFAHSDCVFGDTQRRLALI